MDQACVFMDADVEQVGQQPDVLSQQKSAVALGFTLLVAGAIRARLRTQPYDPYTEVQR